MAKLFGGVSGRYCDGITRRDFVKVGVLSSLGLGVADVLRAQAAGLPPKKDVSCIFIWLEGGPSHIDMWDPKPDAPSEFRGDFKPIETNVSGIRISEHLPFSARQAHRYSIIRSMTHPSADHGRAQHYMETGMLPTSGDFNGKAPNNIHPSFGSIVSKERGVAGPLPPYIALPSIVNSGGSAFLGAGHAPFVIESDPASPQFKVRDVDVPNGLSQSRIGQRQILLDRLNRQDRALENANSNLRSMDTFYQKAHGLITSPEAKKAFDIASEERKTREAYGLTRLGQSCLMARRLVEAGSRFVSVSHVNWDNHTTCCQTLKETLLPTFDRAFATLLEDLQQRGMLDSTLVVVSGDFGRTPRINKDAGRDHWPNVFSVVLAGGGIKGGQVVGASDARGELPADRPVTPEMLAATLFSSLGVDHTRIYHTPTGRPVQVVSDGKPISELI